MMPKKNYRIIQNESNLKFYLKLHIIQINVYCYIFTFLETLYSIFFSYFIQLDVIDPNDNLEILANKLNEIAKNLSSPE